VTPTVDFELDNSSGTKVASSTLTAGIPERKLTYANAAPGTYTLKATSSDDPASATLTETHQVQAFADVTLALKDSTGAVKGSTRSATGSASLYADIAGAGTYTWQITDNSTDIAVPSYTLASKMPRTHVASTSLTLKDSAGNVVATGSGTKPKTISASVNAGSYTLSATPVSGSGNATLTGSYPGAANREVITYDGADHATSINDGATVVTETLNSTGRVLRRVVQDATTNATVEDTTFGYDDSGDSPAYSKPTAGGPVTTYLETAAGLSAIDVGGTITYEHASLHGDIIGTSDAAGTFTAITPTDEFGVGAVPQTRLGWLGQKERFTSDSRLGLIRMGVRLYDPTLGRFLETDPVPGGSANDYDYVSGDPVGRVDLNGQYSSCTVNVGDPYYDGLARGVYVNAVQFCSGGRATVQWYEVKIDHETMRGIWPFRHHGWSNIGHFRTTAKLDGYYARTFGVRGCVRGGKYRARIRGHFRDNHGHWHDSGWVVSFTRRLYC
jgi:RHS repeat-associated protein